MSAYNITKQDYFTSDEMKQLKDSLGNDRNSLLVKLALVTGARESELILITKADLNVESCTVFIKATKNSNDREIRISRPLMYSLQSLPTDTLFDINTSRVRQIWYALRPGSIKKRFHCFRHSFGVELYKASKDIMYVKSAMGHKSINSTMVYVQCVDYEAQMDKTYNHLANLISE